MVSCVVCICGWTGVHDMVMRDRGMNKKQAKVEREDGKERMCV